MLSCGVTIVTWGISVWMEHNVVSRWHVNFNMIETWVIVNSLTSVPTVHFRSWSILHQTSCLDVLSSPVWTCFPFVTFVNNFTSCSTLPCCVCLCHNHCARGLRCLILLHPPLAHLVCQSAHPISTFIPELIWHTQLCNGRHETLDDRRIATNPKEATSRYRRRNPALWICFDMSFREKSKRIWAGWLH